MQKKIAFFTNIAPHYRERLWLAFAKKLNVELHFYFGHNKSQSIAEIDFKDESWKGLEHQLHKTDNFRIDKRLIYQRQVIGQIIFKKWDAVLLLGDANIISNWIIAFIAKLKGIPVIFWGHGVYGNENKLKKYVRKTFLRLADVNLVYGHWSKNLLIKEKFNPNTVKVIYNSVNYEISKPLRESAITPNFYKTKFNNNYPTLIFIGRLTKNKKLHMLIKAVHDLKSKSEDYNLIFIGDGEVKNSLEHLAKQLHVDAYFYGACYDEVKISKFLANADLCVSPSNIGLTSVHAMNYGTPVCTINDFKNQGPEFEAIKAWKTGCFFDKEKSNLAETISKWFKNMPDRQQIRKNCYEVIDSYYNPDVQLKVLDEVLTELLED